MVEASTRSRWAGKELERLGFEVVTVDPRKIRVIAETKHKTDRMDARVLADLLRTGALPAPLWSASGSTCELRDQVRLQWCLVRQRSSLQLRARSMLAAHGITLGKRALASPATWARVLKQRELPFEMRQLLTIVHTAIEALDSAIEEVEQAYAPRLADPVVERMCAMPGVGPVVALTTVAALGDPKWFRDSRHAAAYTGLTPSEHSSGDWRRRARDEASALRVTAGLDPGSPRPRYGCGLIRSRPGRSA